MNKWLRNIKVRTKLLLSFSIILVLIIVVGLISMFTLSRFHQASANIYAENTQPMGYLATMYDNLATQRICVGNIIIFHTQDPQFSSEEIDSLKEKEIIFEEALSNYSKTITSEDEQNIYEKIYELYFNEFSVVKEDALKAVSGGDPSEMAETMKKVDNMGSDISSYLDDAFDYNVEGAKENVDNISSIASVSSIIQIAVILLSILVSLFLAYKISSIISRPLRRVMAVSEQIAETGKMDFDSELVNKLKEDSLYSDEIGHTTAAFGSMVDNYVAKCKTLGEIADGNLSIAIDKSSDEDTIGNAIDSMVSNLNQMFGEVNSVTDLVSSGATEIAEGAHSLSIGASEQASAISELSSTIAEVLDQTQENSNNASEALILVNKAASEMIDTVRCMEELKNTISGITVSSEKISKIITVIDDIAFQTNILALNAAVEAARAGQHGKGFAVVADEVRNLASKSASAASESAILIQESVDSVKSGEEMARKTDKSIELLSETAMQARERIKEINESSQHQEQAISQINMGIDQIFKVVQTNTATAEESAAASAELSSQSKKLKQLIERFKTNNSQ